MSEENTGNNGNVIAQEHNIEDLKADEQKLQGGCASSTPCGIKETLYDKIPLNVKQLDTIIIALIILLIIVFTMGILKGNGVF